jgi:hypothetical protein
MARRSSIKWRKIDKQKLSRTVQRFNAKLTRVAKKYPDYKDYLPQRANVADIKKGISTRQDFNRVVNSLSRFLKKGAEIPVTTKQGIKTTRWEIKETSIKVATINRARTALRKKADVSTYKGTMGSIKKNQLEPKKFNINTIKPSDWNMFIMGVEKQIKSNYYIEKNRQYKENYITALRNNFSPEHAANLISIVNKIPIEILGDLYYDNPSLQIDFIYDPLEEQTIYEVMIEEFEKLGYTV